MSAEQGVLDSSATVATRGPWSWKVRKQFWGVITYIKFKASKPAIVPWPKQYNRKVRTVPFAEFYPTIPAKKLKTMDHIPKDEANPPAQWVQDISVWINNHYSQMQEGLPDVFADDNDAMAEAFTPIYNKIFAIPDSFELPVLPQEFNTQGAPDLGGLAVSSHYDFALQKTDDGKLVWDFSHLANYDHHDGLLSLGLTVEFTQEDDKLQAVKIDCELGEITPENSEWQRAASLAVCAASTYQSIVRHFLYGHVTLGCHAATATRNNLKCDHPLYRMLWPHIYRSHHGLNLVTRTVAEEKGDFVTAFSFTFDGLLNLFDDSYEAMPTCFIDPKLDWQQRGLADTDFATPAQDNMVELYDVMYAHADRYVKHYFPTEESIVNDPQVRAWLDNLNELLPTGIDCFFADGEYTRAGIIQFLAAFLHFCSSIHEALGSSMWNYQMWTSKNPPRMYKDGRRIPIDVFQRMVNADIVMNVSRAPVLADYGFCALDREGEAFFHQFLAELAGLQAKYDKEKSYPWKMEPKILEININN